jgi:hypothetical protein
MFEPNTHRVTRCEQCGHRFIDECGDSFCSSSCEREYEYDHRACEECGEEIGEDNLNALGICEECEDKERED